MESALCVMALFTKDPCRLEDVAAYGTGVRYSNLPGVPPVLAQGAPGASPWLADQCSVHCTGHGHGRRMGFSAPVAVVCLDGLVSGSGCPSREFVASVCCAYFLS